MASKGFPHRGTHTVPVGVRSGAAGLGSCVSRGTNGVCGWPSNPRPTMLHIFRRPIAVALSFAALAGCARNPVTGDLQLALISEAQEIQMGQQAAQEVAQTMGLVDAELLAKARPR